MRAILISFLAILLILSGCINTGQQGTTDNTPNTNNPPQSDNAQKPSMTIQDALQQGKTVMCQYNITSRYGQNISKLAYIIYKSRDAKAIELLSTPEDTGNLTLPATVLIVKDNVTYLRVNRELNGKFCDWIEVTSDQAQSQGDDIKETTELNKINTKTITTPDGKSVEFVTYCEIATKKNISQPEGNVCKFSDITKTS